MNNAKVRIYELSKELNLENKDIIEICEQLNIAVKSHSSTITESQAERIKASAEKYIATHAVSHSSESAKGERKQQILAIHHKQIRPMSPTDVLKAPNPSLAMPPRLPVKSQTTATVTPMPTSHPSDDLSLEEESAVESRQGAIPSQPPEAPPQIPKTEETVAKETKLESPQLLNLPRKLSQKPAPGKVEPSLAAPTAQKAEDPAIGSVNFPTLVKGPKKVQKVGVVGANKPQTDEKKAKPELHRPHLPKLDLDDSIDVLELPMKTRAEESEGEELEDESLTLGLKEKPKLKRLTPPRPSKRPKWEEEEEEEREKEAQNKAAKVAGKAKRRPNLLLDEEEEDLDADKETNLIPVSVSLSTARPLRPKSQTKAATAPTASKPKKAPVRAESGATRTRTERRDRKEVAQRPESVILSGSLTVRDLADLLNVPETEIIRNLFMKGIAVNVTQTLDFDTASLVAVELGVAVETVITQAAATKVTEMIEAGDLQYLHHRPPVVTIMGHVDHGKTTLLDSIRKTKVAQGEAGGITQHIGAYHVDVVHQGRPEQIVFLDTPGHEAFTAMRARGARVTDIAVLVVAADDGVQPQTREAVSHARAAGVPIVVAINKVDKLEANPDRIKQELSELGLVPEEWGGQTIMVSVSALKGENLDTLLDMILLVAEVGELSANPDRVAKGTVIEAHLDRTRGPVATLLVQNGTLRVGDVIVAGSVLGKIRAMIDDRGDKVEAATPSFAVEVLGLNDVPAAGDEFDVFENEKEARSLAQDRTDERRQTRLQQAMSSRRVTLSTISAQAQEGELKELNLILKADVQGSVEAILGSLQQLPQNEVQIRVLLAAPGEVTETDVDLAAASGAVIVGFNTTLASGARHAADREGVDIREYDIIYKLLDDIQGAMEGLLDPEEIESSLGQVEVRAVFPVGKGSVAGCYVLSGKIVRNRQIRVRRGSNVIYEGVLDSLKRMKEDAREVNAGYECGIGVSKFHDWKEGDIIEVYEMTMKRRTLKQ